MVNSNEIGGGYSNLTSLFRGGPPNLTLSDKGGGGKRPDIIYGWPLTIFLKKFLQISP